MAKITMTIEDAPNGSIKIETNPTFASIRSMDKWDHTMAHVYVLKMWDAAITLSAKLNESEDKIIKPSPLIGL